MSWACESGLPGHGRITGRVKIDAPGAFCSECGGDLVEVSDEGS